MPDFTPDQDYFTTAKKRKAAGQEFWKDIYDDFDTDMRLVAGDQWKQADRTARENSGRPALQFNRQANNVQLITNTVRTNKPGIRVNPKSDATMEQAKYYQGIIRHIEYVSQADMCRENALEYSTGGGFGHYRIVTRFVDPSEPDPFAQDIFLEPIVDPKTVLWDPAVFKRLNFREDARWCQVSVRLTWEEYRDRFPNAQHTEWDPAMSSDWGDWADSEGVWVCEYWRVEIKRRKLMAVQGVDGVTNVYSDQLPGDKQPTKGVIAERWIEEREVWCDLINGVEVLEHTRHAGDWIPILTVLGGAKVVEGKMKLVSIVRNNRDSQQLYNAALSGVAENIGLTNRVPYKGIKGSFKSDKNWQTAHLSNPAYLEWDPVYSDQGQLLNPGGPERQSPEAAIGALSQLTMMMSDSMKAGSGIFDSSLGAAPAEYSGVSVEKRTQQSNLTNMHFGDNLARTMWDEGQMLLQLIRRVIDRPRALRIIGEDGTASMVPVTMPVKMSDGTEQVPEVPGYEGKPHLRLDQGSFDVAITTGPSYPTKKLEEFYAWKEMAQADPLIMQAAGDIIYKNAPFEGAEIISESYLALMNPAIQTMRQSKDGDVPPQMLKIQNAQLQSQVQQLMAAAQQLKQEQDAKLLEIHAENQRNSENNAVKLQVEGMKQQYAEAQALFQSEMAAIKHRLDMFMTSETHASPMDQAEAQAALAPPEPPAE